MDQQESPPMPEGPQSTGVDAVDEVLAQVSSLADRPVSEHTAVFERAHAQLRRALDAQPDAQPDHDHGV